MANPFPPPSSVVLLLLLPLITSVAGAINATDAQQLNTALQSLRNHGYTLFTNAVTTSDLQYELLTTRSSAAADHSPLASFTIFAPKDEMLIALDMATDAAVYVNTLRYHIIPNHRYNFADLQNLSSPFLDTLLPHFAILVAKAPYDDVFSDTATDGLMIDGVRISDPDIFLGSRIAVHGIDGILLSGLNMSQDSPDRSDILPTVESPATIRNIPVEEMFQLDQNNPTPAPAAATPPSFQFGQDNIPADPAEGNFPAGGSFTPVIHHATHPKNMYPQMEKLKRLAQKMRRAEKQRRKGQRRHNHHHRRHRAPADHLLNEL